MERLVQELPNRRATIQLGRALAGVLVAGDLIVLEGELGAGKTFLARAICRGLGVPTSVPVTSPTFTLVHELEGRLPIAHADLYRLRAAAELRDLGLRERRSEGAVVVVEWGAPHLADLGGDAVTIRLVDRAGKMKRAELSATGRRSEALLDGLRREIGHFEPAC